jgi:hypothetical protein
MPPSEATLCRIHADHAVSVYRFAWSVTKDEGMAQEVVKGDLKLFTLDDPARPGHLPGFRLENGGYLLWSAGPDAKDDGGEKDKDWLWRVTFSLPNPA